MFCQFTDVIYLHHTVAVYFSLVPSLDYMLNFIILLNFSMRLFSRKNQKNLTTVLPPPDISPLQRVLSVCYSREYNMVFVLITPMDIWVYTTK